MSHIGTTSLSQRGPESNGNRGVDPTPGSSKIEASPLDTIYCLNQDTPKEEEGKCKNIIFLSNIHKLLYMRLSITEAAQKNKKNSSFLKNRFKERRIFKKIEQCSSLCSNWEDFKTYLKQVKLYIYLLGRNISTLIFLGYSFNQNFDGKWKDF